MTSTNEIEPRSPNVMEPVEDPEAGELQEEPIHDQLPTVEEAKANVELDGSDAKPKRSRCRLCIYTCCCICSGFIFFLILAVIFLELGKSAEKHASSKSSHGDRATLPPGAFEPRVDYIREFLSAFSDEAALNEVGTPQWRASKWIADEDVLHMPIDDPTFIERYALAVFYYAMGGLEWPLHLGFLTERSTCDWYHIGFGSDDKPRHVGANCQEGQKIQQLFFRKFVAHFRWLFGLHLEQIDSQILCLVSISRKMVEWTVSR
jgi:hypothetical protein